MNIRNRQASDGKSAVGTDDDTFCTVEQFAAIKLLAKELNIKPQATSRQLFNASTEDLSISGANDVIKHLKNLKAARFRHHQPTR